MIDVDKHIQWDKQQEPFTHAHRDNICSPSKNPNWKKHSECNTKQQKSTIGGCCSAYNNLYWQNFSTNSQMMYPSL